MCSFFHGKEKIIECFYGFIDTDYINSGFLFLRKDSPQKSYRSEQYKHETSGEKRKEGENRSIGRGIWRKKCLFLRIFVPF